MKTKARWVSWVCCIVLVGVLPFRFLENTWAAKHTASDSGKVPFLWVNNPFDESQMDLMNEVIETAPSGSRVSFINYPSVISSAATVGVLYPLYLAKMRKQYGGNLTAVNHSVYQGFMPYSVAYVASKGTFFTAYDQAQKLGLSPFAAGWAGGIIEDAATTPLWVYLARKGLVGTAGDLKPADPAMSAQSVTLREFLQEAKKNPMMLYRGSAINYAAIGLNCGVYFHLFEAAKRDFGLNDFQAGFLTRLLLSPVSFPIDLIRTNKQNGLSYPDIIKSLAEQNLRRTYSGWGFATLRSSMAAGIGLWLMSEIQKYSQQHNGDSLDDVD